MIVLPMRSRDIFQNLDQSKFGKLFFKDKKMTIKYIAQRWIFVSQRRHYCYPRCADLEYDPNGYKKVLSRFFFKNK